jgi:hypothetical protein
VVQLSPKDSAILTRITRYRTISQAEGNKLLTDASPEARQIGEIILGTSTGHNVTEATRAAAEAYRRSLKTKPRPDVSGKGRPRRKISR